MMAIGVVRTNQTEVVEEIIQYINSHISDELAWETLATRLYMSKSTFHRLFTAVTGVPVARYIREAKLNHAVFFLLNTDTRVTDIAYELGFQSHDAFTRAFRSFYGVTPSKMRRLYGIKKWFNRFFIYKNKRGDVNMNELLWARGVPARVPFTAGEKRECLKTVELLVKLAETARREGLLALENVIEREADTLVMKKGLQMVCDGIPPDTIISILQNYILSSSYEGADLLKRLLAVEGVPAIQSGENPYILRERLLSILGEEFYNEACLYLGMGPDRFDSETAAHYFDDMENETYPAGTNLLENTFLHLSNRSIQLILRETDMAVFIPAFRGSSKKIQKRICNNLSQALAAHVLGTCVNDPLPDTETIIKAQHEMLSLHHKILAGGYES